MKKGIYSRKMYITMDIHVTQPFSLGCRFREKLERERQARQAAAAAAKDAKQNPTGYARHWGAAGEKFSASLI